MEKYVIKMTINALKYAVKFIMGKTRGNGMHIIYMYEKMQLYNINGC